MRPTVGTRSIGVEKNCRESWENKEIDSTHYFVTHPNFYLLPPFPGSTLHLTL